MLLTTAVFSEAIQKKDNYKIAVLLPLSGERAVLGSNVKQGIELFLKFMQKAQGFERFKFDILLLDTQSDETKALKLAEYIEKRSSDFLFIAGATYPNVVDKLVKVAESKKIPYLFPFRSSFKEQLTQYYFPVLPSHYHGYKFLIDFLNKKKMSYKLIYDEKTRDNAFLLTDSDNLLEMNDKNFDKKTAEASVIFVSDENVEKVLKKLGKKTRKFMNYSQIELVEKSKEKALWENVLFLNWVKTADSDSVKFFKKYYKETTNEEANNFQMLGWIFMDMVYEVVSKAAGRKNMLINSEDFVKELEGFSAEGGYNSGCAYKIFYEPFSLSKPYSRLGISGLYFLEYNDNEFVMVSDFSSIIK